MHEYVYIQSKWNLCAGCLVLSWFSPSYNKETHSCSLTLPLPQWDREENQKEKAELGGWDKNRLTE